MLDMGLDPFNFGDSLLACSRSAVRRLCTQCRKTRAPRTTRPRAVGRLHARFGDEPPIGRDVVLAGWMQRNSRDGRLVLHASRVARPATTPASRAAPACTR